MNIKFLTINNISEIRKEDFLFVKQFERFYTLFNQINFPITLVIENFYNDRDYKDSYYYFFSSKYIGYSKYTYRIAIFEGSIQESEFYNKEFDLNDLLIGVTTIKPLKIGSVGKTYFNPNKINHNKFYIRTTKFEIGILGRKFEIESFPFSAQDSEYITCAETTLWMMLQYYGTRYKEYKVALPHEIVEIVDDKHFQRVSPSSGLHYMQSSEVLKKFGFSSQIY